MNYATVGDASSPALLLDPRPDRVVVGLRAGAAAARRPLPGVRRRPARPGPEHADAGPLHARQLRQRPRPLHRHRHRPADHRERPVVRRRPRRRGCRPTPSPGRSSPRSTRTRRCSRPRCGPRSRPGIRQGIGPIFDLWSTYLGDQWSIGAWDAMRAAAPRAAPRASWRPCPSPTSRRQNLKEYDPEWGRAFWSGTVAASCDHERMLRSVKVPVLLTHHFRMVDDATGMLMGAMTDQQAQRVQDLLTEAGVPVEYRSFPTMGHAMHDRGPAALRRHRARLGRDARRLTHRSHGDRDPAA